LSLGLFVVLAAALVAGVASGLTGFGLALILVPAMLLFYEPATVVSVAIILGIFVALTVIADSWREIQSRVVLALLPFAFVGLVVGSQILKVVDEQYIQLSAGAVVVCAAGLLIKSVRLPGSKTGVGTAVAGLTSGTLSTSIGLPGPPIVLLFAARGLPKRNFRVNNAAYFLSINLVGLAILFLRGIAGPEDLPLAAALVPAAFIGKALGTVMLKGISEQMFRIIALGVTALTGVLGALTALWALL
jgi:uncharacterized membrane protein YfcA